MAKYIRAVVRIDRDFSAQVDRWASEAGVNVPAFRAMALSLGARFLARAGAADVRDVAAVLTEERAS